MTMQYIQDYSCKGTFLLSESYTCDRETTQPSNIYFLNLSVVRMSLSPAKIDIHLILRKNVANLETKESSVLSVGLFVCLWD